MWWISSSSRRLLSSSSSPSKVLIKVMSSSSSYSDSKSTHFGFSNVSEKEKASKVRSVFDSVSSNYDLMNDLMSGGIHRVWKDIFISRLSPRDDMRLIDVAGGTGDIAFRFLKYQTKGNKVPLGRSVLVCDINPNMLEVGKGGAPPQGAIEWMTGDAESLDAVPSSSFDAYTIAYGLRNCVHPERVLKEAFRVLKPGGRFLCLEFSHVTHPLLKKVYDAYSFSVIPAMGQVVAGDFASYKYLVESIRKWPRQEEFKGLIEGAGFRFVTFEDLSWGVSCIHSGYKV